MMRTVGSFKLQVLLSIFVITYAVQARASALDRAAGDKIIREMAAQVNSSKSLEEVYKKFGLWSPFVKSVFEAEKIDFNGPAPKVEFQPVDQMLIFKHEKQELKVKVVSLPSGDFKIGSVYFHYDSKAQFVRNLFSLLKSRSDKTASALSPSHLFLPEAFAQADKPSDAMGDRFIHYSPSVYGVGSYALAVGGAPAAWVAAGANFLVYNAESWMAPGCTQQIAELRKLLETEPRLALKELSCGEYIPSKDTFIEVHEGPGRVRRVYADFPNNQAWTRTDGKKTIGYIFDDQKLSKINYYDSCAHISDSDPEVKGGGCDFLRVRGPFEGSPEFEEQRKKIEPYRRLLYFINTNRTCYNKFTRCDREINRVLATGKWPYASSAESKPHEDPASAVREMSK